VRVTDEVFFERVTRCRNCLLGRGIDGPEPKCPLLNKTLSEFVADAAATCPELLWAEESEGRPDDRQGHAARSSPFVPSDEVAESIAICAKHECYTRPPGGMGGPGVCWLIRCEGKYVQALRSGIFPEGCPRSAGQASPAEPAPDEMSQGVSIGALSGKGIRSGFEPEKRFRNPGNL
jgi:hypothetical protein